MVTWEEAEGTIFLSGGLAMVTERGVNESQVCQVSHAGVYFLNE